MLHAMNPFDKKSWNTHRSSVPWGRSVDRFLRNNFVDLWDGPVETTPSINIREEKDKYIVDMAAPGLKKEDFRIDLEGHQLTISCEKEEESNDNRENFSRREYSYTSFSRSLTLPENADSEAVNAKYTDGILSLTIPKKEVQREGAKNIRVE